MIPGFGAHYRAYRVRVAIERLRAMPGGTTLSFTKAAHLLGVSESAVRTLVRRSSPPAAEGQRLSATTLLAALRKAQRPSQP